MYHVLREVDNMIYVYDDSDGTLDFVDKSILLDNDDLEYVGMDATGNVTKDICIIDMKDCNFLDGDNIWDACEAIDEEATDENGFSIYVMHSGGRIFKFKETFGKNLLFTSNIVVKITEELLDVIQEFL